MQYAIGFLCGVAFSTLVVATLAYFKKAIEERVEIMGQMLEAAGPQPRGYIIEPGTEADEARKAIIEKNQSEGKDTKLADLYE